MERGNHYQQGQIIEIDVEDPVTERSLGVNKTCGEAPCGFSDVGSVSKDAQERSASMQKLFISVGLCFVFMSIEVVGGIKANSLAILTDAAHLLSDVAAFAISLFALWAAGWEANPRQSYGFFRIEILGALVSIQLIWLLAGILVYEAIVRLIHDTGEVNGFLMFLVSAFGLLVNIIMALVLGHDHGHDHGHGGYDHHGHGHDHGHGGNDHHGHGHDHEHGGSGHNNGVKIATHNHPHKDEKHHHENHEHEHEHDHDHAHEEGNTQPLLDRSSDDKDGANNNVKGSKKWNINVQGAYLHVLGDSIQSVGVMIGGAVIWYEPKWKMIDLICTLIFSVVVLSTTIKMLRNIVEVLMESTPKEIDASKVEKGLLEMEEVVAIHELHIWAITVGKILLACHVKVFPESDADIVLNKVIDYLRREYNITHVTIQIEH